MSTNIPLTPDMLGAVDPEAVKKLLYGDRVDARTLVKNSTTSESPDAASKGAGSSLASSDQSKPAPQTMASRTPKPQTVPATATQQPGGATAGGSPDDQPAAPEDDRTKFFNSPEGKAAVGTRPTDTKPYGVWRRMGIGLAGAAMDYGHGPGKGNEFVNKTLDQNAKDAKAAEDYDKNLPTVQDAAYKSHQEQQQRAANIPKTAAETANLNSEATSRQAPAPGQATANLQHTQAETNELNTRATNGPKVAPGDQPAQPAHIQDFASRLKTLGLDPASEKTFVNVPPGTTLTQLEKRYTDAQALKGMNQKDRENAIHDQEHRDSQQEISDQRAQAKEAKDRKMVIAQDKSGHDVMVSAGEADKGGYQNAFDAPADSVNKALAARHFVPLVDNKSPDSPGILQMIDKLDERGKLGVVASRWNDFLAGKVGSGDQDFERLRVAMGLATTLLMNLHVGSRGGSYMMEHFEDLAKAGKMDAATLKAGVDQELKYAKDRSMRPSAEGTPKPESHVFDLGAWKRDNPGKDSAAIEQQAKTAGYDIKQ